MSHQIPGITLACLLLLAACGEDPAPPAAPQPAAPAASPATETPAAAPAPATQAQQAETAAPDPDKALAGQVLRALEGESKVRAAAIDVTAADGKVTLWGTASSEEEREGAARTAAKVDGVKSVENKLAVVRGS